MKIYSKPLTDEERSKNENFGKPLKTPVRYHLIDCLKELKFGRPTSNQKLLQNWIDELYDDPDKGVPFL